MAGTGSLRVLSGKLAQSRALSFKVLCRIYLRAPVAQLDRALPSGGRGQGFESLRACQLSSRVAR